jgi:hypothetical protein
MARPQVADRKDDPSIWKVVAKGILIRGQPKMGCPPPWGLGEAKNYSPHSIGMLRNALQKPRTRTDPSRQRKMDMRYGTRNVEYLQVLVTDDSHKKERNHLNLSVDGRIILKRICKKYERIWLRIGTSGGLL